MFDDVIVVYKFYGDLMFFVTGSQEENELIIYAVLQAFYESISLLLRRGTPAGLQNAVRLAGASFAAARAAEDLRVATFEHGLSRVMSRAVACVRVYLSP